MQPCHGNPLAPASAEAARLRGIVNQLPLKNQQFINQLVINLLFGGLKMRKLVVVLYPLDYHFTLNQGGASAWSGPGNQ